MSAPAALLSEIDTEGEPIALLANEFHIYELPGGKRLTIAASPIYTPMFMSYCGMVRRTDLLVDPRFATARLRRTNLELLLAEVRAWILTFEDLAQLQTQVSEAGLAVGEVRSITEFAKTDWVKEWNAIVEIDIATAARRRCRALRGSSAAPNFQRRARRPFRASTIPRSARKRRWRPRPSKA